MSKEIITVDIEVKVVLNIDLESRPENWDLFKEVEQQISFSDAQAWIVHSVRKVQRQT